MTTTTALRPHSPVCWSTGGTTNVGTLLPSAPDTPIGHSRVLVPSEPARMVTLNVMTLALRAYEPTPADVDRMRTWLTGCGYDLAGVPDANVIDYVGHQCTAGHGLFVR